VEPVLCICTDSIALDGLRNASSPAQIEVLIAGELNSALELLRENSVRAILIYLPIEGPTFEELLSQVQKASPNTPLVICEPKGAAVRGATLELPGIFRYIPRPAPASELLELLGLAIRGVKPAAEPVITDGKKTILVGSSKPMRDVVEVIRLVGNRRSTVLITGETGTGKEVAARAIHLASGRPASKMVAINCAALPDHLLEAELFGHTKGAFTGAWNARTGLFEQANRGTIFLDEIGEMPLQLQSKLLRVLQEREIQRIGSSETIPVDVRVIAASNQNLQEAVAQRRFREDLFYRLNVVALRMPPLRDRVTDIPELVQHFLHRLSEQDAAPPKQITSAALEFLTRYSWPGNVRQLEHALESAVALSGLRTFLDAADFAQLPETGSSEMGPLSQLDVPESGLNFEELIMGIERRLLQRALFKSGGNKARAAHMLQMKRTTLISKFKSLEVCA